MELLTPPDFDVDALRIHRLSRLRAQMDAAGVDLAVLSNPVSLRYASDWEEYALFQSRIPTYYLFVHADGRMVMHGAYAETHPVIDEFRPAHYLNVFDGGLDSQAAAFADGVAAEVDPGSRVAVERAMPSVLAALTQRGLDVIDAERLMELARMKKSPDELTLMRYSIDVAERAMVRMRSELRPGITENELFAILYETNIAHGGGWIDGRMLCSGPRTNPWYQESSDRRLEPGDPLAFDTDMIGPFWYCADISRTWVTPGGPPSPQLLDRYDRAREEIEHNVALLEPGLSFHEWSQKAFRQADEFIDNRYACLAHGVGMTDEYPKIYYREDWDLHGYDGVIEVDTVMCVESFVGSGRGGPGVKLEQMYLVTERGTELLSHYPIDRDGIGG